MRRTVDAKRVGNSQILASRQMGVKSNVLKIGDGVQVYGNLPAVLGGNSPNEPPPNMRIKYGSFNNSVGDVEIEGLADCDLIFLKGEIWTYRRSNNGWSRQNHAGYWMCEIQTRNYTIENGIIKTITASTIETLNNTYQSSGVLHATELNECWGFVIE